MDGSLSASSAYYHTAPTLPIPRPICSNQCHDSEVKNMYGKWMYVRMLQKFPDTRYWLDSPGKQLFHFFREPSFGSYAFWHVVKPLVPSLSPGTSSTALMNATHASSALSNKVPFNCFSLLEIRRIRRKKGPANTLGTVYAAPHSHLESQPLLLLCAYWHCHDEGKGHSPVFGRCWYQTSKTFRRKWCPY